MALNVSSHCINLRQNFATCKKVVSFFEKEAPGLKKNESNELVHLGLSVTASEAEKSSWFVSSSVRSVPVLLVKPLILEKVYIFRKVTSLKFAFYCPTLKHPWSFSCRNSRIVPASSN